MKPKITSTNQFSLFQAHFNQILNLDHELCLLANAIEQVERITEKGGNPLFTLWTPAFAGVTILRLYSKGAVSYGDW